MGGKIRELYLIEEERKKRKRNEFRE